MDISSIHGYESIYHYRVSGLLFQSNVPLSLRPAELVEGVTPDVVFTLKRVRPGSSTMFWKRNRIGDIRNGAGHPSISVWRVGADYLLDCHSGQKRIRFLMPRDGRWIDCYPEAGSRTEDIEVWLFGLVWAFILQERGIFTLHGAAINCHGRAVAFLGANTHGKTTLALFFLQKGHSLITDDVLPLVQHGPEIVALPASPTMNLWSNTLPALGMANGGVANGDLKLEKHRYMLQSFNLQFCDSSTPLNRIYLLHRKSEPGTCGIQITPVPPARALIELLAYTRANSTIEVVRQRGLLKFYERLLSQATIRTLSYTSGFEFLPTVYSALLDDLEI